MKLRESLKVVNQVISMRTIISRNAKNNSEDPRRHNHVESSTITRITVSYKNNLHQRHNSLLHPPPAQANKEKEKTSL